MLGTGHYRHAAGGFHGADDFRCVRRYDHRAEFGFPRAPPDVDDKRFATNIQQGFAWQALGAQPGWYDNYWLGHQDDVAPGGLAAAIGSKRCALYVLPSSAQTG